MQDTRLENHQDGLNIAEHFQSDRPKLLVIDESHNLRNAKSNRYKFLVETLLKTNDNLKVLMLSGYQPAFYVEQAEDVAMLHDERMRDRFLVKMMYILLVKRLESSWFSFMSTVEKVLAHHENALRKINEYQMQQASDEVLDDTPEADLFDEGDEIETEEFTLGKKRKVKLSDIARAGNLDAYRQDLKQDIERLDSLRSNVTRFHQAIDQGEAEAIQSLKAVITSWLRAQAVAEQPADDGTARVKMGNSARDVLEKLKRGDREAVKRLKQNVTVEETFQPEHFDLIVWFVVS